MKKITLIIFCLIGSFALTVSADRVNDKLHPQKAQAVVVDDEAVFVLDSLYTDYPAQVQAGKERTYHYYNNDAKMILTEAHWWDEENVNIIGGAKYERDYDANGNETLHAAYNWDANVNVWKDNYRDIREYDANGNMIMEIKMGMDPWSGTDDVVNLTKNLFAYDEVNKLTYDTLQTWNSSTSEWEKSKYIWHYYMQNTDKKTAITTFVWDEEEERWIRSFRDAYSYDENLNRATWRTSLWIDNTWWDTMIIYYKEYDEYGNFGEVSENYWNDDTNGWDEWFRQKFEYTYDERGNMLTSEESWMDLTTEEWGPKYRYEYEYDKFDNLSSYARYDWSTYSNKWIGIHKFDYVYNDDNLWIDFFEYGWTAEGWEYARRNYITYDENKCMEYETGAYWIDGEWIDFQWNHWFYSQFNPTSINPVITAEPIKVFSSGKDIVVANNLKGDNIRVYDLQGRLHNVANNPADRHAIPMQTGIYIVRVGNYAAKVAVK